MRGPGALRVWHCMPLHAAGLLLLGCASTPTSLESPAAAFDGQLRGARELAESGRIAESLAVLATLLETHPGRLDLRFEKAGLHRLLRQHALAARELDEILRLHPGNALALLMGAENLAVDGFLDDEGPDRLGRHLDRLVEAHPELTAAFAARARRRFQFSGDFAGAKSDVESTLRLDPDHPEALAIRAYLAMSEGRFEDAVPDVERAAKSDPSMARTCFLWGQWAEKAREWTRAEACYALSERLGMGGWRPPGALAYVEYHLGKPERCIASCTRAIELEKPGVRMLRHRGMALHYLGRMDEAERDFSAAVDAGERSALYARGTLHFRKGDLEKAAADFDACAAATEVWEPFREYSRLRTWQIRGLQGDGTSADEALRTYLLSRRPQGSDDWFLFLALAVLQEPQQAFDCITLGEASKPPEETRERVNELMYYLGVRAKRDGNAKRARKCFEECLKADVTWMDEYWCARDELPEEEGK